MASRSSTLIPGSGYDAFTHDQEKNTGLNGSVDHDSMRKISNEKSEGKEQRFGSTSWKNTQSKSDSSQTSDPFGDESGEAEGVKYKTLTWWQSAALMIAETVSLGILSLPSVLSTIGLVPGAVLIIGLGAIATYTGYVLGQFKARYPWVHNMGDAGYVLFEPFGPGWAKFGREFLGLSQVILLVFSMASHLLTWTICLNTLTNSSVCTIVWSVVGLALFWIFDLPRTMKRLSWLACASFVSITSAVLITIIAIAVQNPAKGNYHLTQKVEFAQAFSSVTTLIFAYIGHVCFFSFISEMRDPAEFTKSLVTLQAVDTGMYLVAGVVIYYYGGDSVTSPALGSTGPLLSKIAYGIAIPTILIAGVIIGHVASKLIYVRMFRGTPHMADERLLSKGSLAWAAITLVLWIIAWIIAESIPNFNTLLGLISSLFGSWFTYGISGIFWLFLNRYGGWVQGWKKTSLMVVNWLLVVLGATICGVGLYATGKELHDSTGGGSWTCSGSSSSSA